jgi:glycerate kinase
MSSNEAGESCCQWIRSVFGEKIETNIISLSDGGEGFLESLVDPFCLVRKKVPVVGANNFILISCKGPLGNEIFAEYGINVEKKIAVVEMVSIIKH